MTEKQTVKFGDICKEVKLTTKDPIGDGYERYIGLEHLDSGSLKIKRWGMIAEDSPSFTRVFKKGQLLFGKRRPYLKKAAIAEFDGICSGDIIVMEPLDNLSEPELLKFIVQSEKFWQHAVNTSSGSLSPRTKYKEIAKLAIELPCFREQKKLYAALSKVQSTTVLNDELLSMSSRLESSTLNELCFGCGDNKGFWGSYSKDFDEMALGALTLESAFGPRYPSDKYSENGSIGTIRTTDFDDNAQVNYQSIPMAELDEVKFRQHLLETGDLLITRSGTCGLVAVHEECDRKIIPGAFIIRFRLKPEVNPYYVKLFMMLPRVQHFISQLASGGVQKNLTSKNLLKIPILYPRDESMVENILATKSCFFKVISELKERDCHLKRIQESLINRIM